MNTLADIESRIDAVAVRLTAAPLAATAAMQTATELLHAGEAVLSLWVASRGQTPTSATREGFRLLALHRQGARGDPSFNACRETCRELVYHHNLITADLDHSETAKRANLMVLIAKHLLLFVAGKLETAGLGEFCCSSEPLRSADA